MQQPESNAATGTPFQGNTIYFLLLFYCLFILFPTSTVISLLVFCLVAVASALDPAPSSLKYAFGFIRHGVASPKYKDYLLAIYGEETVNDLEKKSSDGLGSLSNFGKDYMKDEVGRSLRERYGNFLGSYREDNLYVSSVQSPIALMSAQAAMAGMIPDKTVPVKQDTTDFDKAYMTLSRDTPENATSICPVYGKLFGEGIKHLNEPDRRSDIKKIYDVLTEHIKKPITTRQQLADIFDTLYLSERNGIKPPKWATDPQKDYGNDPLYPHLLLPFLDEYFRNIQFLKRNENMLTLFTGPLFNKLETRFKEIAADPAHPQKMWLHFTYDSTMYVLIRALQIDYVSWAEPGDGIIFELHEIDNQKIIKVILFEPVTEIKIAELENKLCSDPCTLESFTENFKALTPEEWSKLCNTQTGQ